MAGYVNTWKKAREAAETKRATPKVKSNPEVMVRAGICDSCGHGGFSLRVKEGKMDRICRGCGEIKENV